MIYGHLWSMGRLRSRYLISFFFFLPSPICFLFLSIFLFLCYPFASFLHHIFINKMFIFYFSPIGVITLFMFLLIKRVSFRISRTQYERFVLSRIFSMNVRLLTFSQLHEKCPIIIGKKSLCQHIDIFKIEHLSSLCKFCNYLIAIDLYMDGYYMK